MEQKKPPRAGMGLARFSDISLASSSIEKLLPDLKRKVGIFMERHDDGPVYFPMYIDRFGKLPPGVTLVTYVQG